MWGRVERCRFLHHLLVHLKPWHTAQLLRTPISKRYRKSGSLFLAFKKAAVFSSHAGTSGPACLPPFFSRSAPFRVVLHSFPLLRTFFLPFSRRRGSPETLAAVGAATTATQSLPSASRMAVAVAAGGKDNANASGRKPPSPPSVNPDDDQLAVPLSKCHSNIALISISDNGTTEATVKLQVRCNGKTFNLSRNADEPVVKGWPRLEKRFENCQLPNQPKKAKRCRKAEAQRPSLQTPAANHLVFAPLSTPNTSPVTLLSSSGIEIPITSTTTWAEALADGVRFQIQNETVTCLMNALQVTKIAFMGDPTPGLFTVVSFTVTQEADGVSSGQTLADETCGSEALPSEQLSVIWLSPAPGMSANDQLDSGELKEALRDLYCCTVPLEEGLQKWSKLVVHVGQTFMPSKDHLGSSMTVVVVPAVYRCLGMHLTLPPVKESTTALPDWRLGRLAAFKQTPTEASSIRIGSFNILAEDYARTPLAINAMFPYCPKEILDIEYRTPHILTEIESLDCDILGLQECTSKFYHHILEPFMSERYTAQLTLKTGRVSEGCCFFYDKRKFRLHATHIFDFASEFKKVTTENPALKKDILDKLPEKFVEDVVPCLTTVFQLFVLECVESKQLLIVSNTHLFFHPDAGHIRMLQAFLLVYHLEELRQSYAERGHTVGIVMMGDFNALIGSGTHALLTERRVSRLCKEWNFDFTFSPKSETEDVTATAPLEGAELVPNEMIHNISFGIPVTQPSAAGAIETVPQSNTSAPEADAKTPPVLLEGVDLELPATFPSLVDAYGHAKNRVTNVVNEFEGNLDYIFFSSDTLKLCRILSDVPLNVLRSHGGLPCPGYPSDHISIGAEIAFR